MNGCRKNQQIIKFSLRQINYYSFITLLSMVFLSDSVGARTALVELQIAQQPATTQPDPTRAEADKLTKEGLQLYKQGSAESLLAAKKKWEQALVLWRELDDKERQATTLVLTGRVYSDLGEKQKALEFYNQALPLHRAIDNKKGEATTLNNIGLVYSDLGEKQKALEFYNRALPLRRAAGDRGGEATTLNNIGSVYDALGEKQKSLEFYNRALPLFLAVNDKNGEATTLNNIGLVYSDLGEKQKALEFYNRALPLRRAAGDRGGEATTLNNIGSVYDALGEKQKALEYYNQALPLLHAVGNKGGEATTLNNIGQVYSGLGEKQKALELFNQALPLLHAVGDKGGEATTLNNIGSVHSDLGEKQKALEFYNKALPLYQAVGDRDGEATTQDNIGQVYSGLGEKQKALELFNQALPLYQAVGDRAGEATTLSNIGLVYSDLGEKQKALEFFNKALPLLRVVGDRAGEASILNNIAGVYSDLGEKQKALEFLNQALPLRRAVGDRSGEAVTLNNIGRVYNDLGKNQSALEFLNQALPLLRAVGDRRVEAVTLNNIGRVYSDLAENQKALQFYNQALALSRAVGDRGGEGATLSNIGRVYSALGENQKAREFFNQALPLRRVVGDKGGEAKTLYNLSILERKTGNLQAALQQIDSAIKIIEDLRTKVDNKELRTSYFSSVQDYYQFKIDLLMQLHKQNPNQGYDALALHTNESSRARVLIELLTEANAKIRKGANPQLLAQDQELQQRLNAKEKARVDILSTAKDSDTGAQATKEQLTKEIAEIISQQQELKTKISISNPEYFNLKYPKPLELKGIQQQLDKDTILLQYSLGKEHSYLWVVTPDSLQTYELPKAEDIEKAATEFHNRLTQANAIDFTIEDSQKLSQMILAPVANKLGKKRLVIVADGALQTIPFAALSEPSGEKYQPLLVNHEIVNLPSITALATQRKQLNNRQLSPKTLAVLADPVFSTEQAQGKPQTLAPELDLNRSTQQRAMKNLKRNGLIPLPGTRIEAEAMLKLVPSGQSIHAYGVDANYSFASNPNLKQYQHLFFATHGFADPKNPELSGIVLAQVDKNGKSVEKGYLRLGDIFNMDWAAELVVLSACETGLGKDTKGEGLVGLTRGLMYAGSKRAVVSLWNVSDKGTSELMPKFYKSVLGGKSPAVALREAQLQMWQGKEWRNPYYWAAFTLQGEWR
jgi:CHAT domain-containing protein/Tfp pilus assembly protein PilF